MRKTERKTRLQVANKGLVSSLTKVLSLNGLMSLVGAVRLQTLEKIIIKLYSE